MKTLTSSFTTSKTIIFSQLVTIICVVFTLYCSESLQNIVSGLGILSFGIIHGANDLKILSKKKLKNNSLLGIPFLKLYILVVLLGVLIFYFIPGIALLTFVVVSCYHFGEQHWQGKLDYKKRTLIFYTAYGSTIFLMLFSFHYPEVENIIFQISSISIPFQFFWMLLLFVGSVLMLFMYFKIKNINNLLSEAMLLGILALLFYKGSLLFGFGLYFVLWHSLPSLKSQITYLYGAKEGSPYIRYLKSAFLYWVLALIGLVSLYFFGVLPKDQYLSVFFSFLAAITFPHVIVMGLMFQSPKHDSN